MNHPYRMPPEGLRLSLAPQRWRLVAKALLALGLLALALFGCTRLPLVGGLASALILSGSVLFAMMSVIVLRLRPHSVVLLGDTATFHRHGWAPVCVSRAALRVTHRKGVVTFDEAGEAGWVPGHMSKDDRRAVFEAFASFAGYDVFAAHDVARRLAQPVGDFGPPREFESRPWFIQRLAKLMYVVGLAPVVLTIALSMPSGWGQATCAVFALTALWLRRRSTLRTVEVHAGGVVLTYRGGRTVRVTRDELLPTGAVRADGYLHFGRHKELDSSFRPKDREALVAALTALVGYDITDPHGEVLRLSKLAPFSGPE